MPFQSRSQMRYLFATHPRMAKRWAEHTPDIKALPEKKEPDRDKQAFVAHFLNKCAAAGLTTPAQIAAAAAELARTKRASGDTPGGPTVAGTLGSALGYWPLTAALGSVVAPAMAGYGIGQLAGRAKNQTDVDDAEALRSVAHANALRRRTVLVKNDAEVRKLLASDPKRYLRLS